MKLYKFLWGKKILVIVLSIEIESRWCKEGEMVRVSFVFGIKSIIEFYIFF